MRLDTDILAGGDKLYDIVERRYFIVASISGNVALIKGSQGLIQMDSKGRVRGKRRFYWHNPIVFIPRKKDADLAEKVKSLAAVTRDW